MPFKGRLGFGDISGARAAAAEDAEPGELAEPGAFTLLALELAEELVTAELVTAELTGVLVEEEPPPPQPCNENTMTNKNPGINLVAGFIEKSRDCASYADFYRY